MAVDTPLTQTQIGLTVCIVLLIVGIAVSAPFLVAMMNNAHELSTSKSDELRKCRGEYQLCLDEGSQFMSMEYKLPFSGEVSSEWVLLQANALYNVSSSSTLPEIGFVSSNDYNKNSYTITTKSRITGIEWKINGFDNVDIPVSIMAKATSRIPFTIHTAEGNYAFDAALILLEEGEHLFVEIGDISGLNNSMNIEIDLLLSTVNEDYVEHPSLRITLNETINTWPSAAWTPLASGQFIAFEDGRVLYVPEDPTAGSSPGDCLLSNANNLTRWTEISTGLNWNSQPFRNFARLTAVRFMIMFGTFRYVFDIDTLTNEVVDIPVTNMDVMEYSPYDQTKRNFTFAYSVSGNVYGLNLFSANGGELPLLPGGNGTLEQVYPMHGQLDGIIVYTSTKIMLFDIDNYVEEADSGDDSFSAVTDLSAEGLPRETDTALFLGGTGVGNSMFFYFLLENYNNGYDILVYYSVKGSGVWNKQLVSGVDALPVLDNADPLVVLWYDYVHNLVCIDVRAASGNTPASWENTFVSENGIDFRYSTYRVDAHNFVMPPRRDWFCQIGNTYHKRYRYPENLMQSRINSAFLFQAILT